MTPGLAITTSGAFPHSYLRGGKNFLDSIAYSQVITWPVYVAIRPMIARKRFFVIYSPSFSALPPRMLVKRAFVLKLINAFRRLFVFEPPLRIVGDHHFRFIEIGPAATARLPRPEFSISHPAC